MVKKGGMNKMSKKIRGKRDGTSSFEGSYQSEISDKGKRKEKGEECPFIKKKGVETIKW